MSEEKAGDKKLHVDAGWKEQVRQEKEQLAEKGDESPPSGGGKAAGTREEAGGEEHGSLPAASFETLVQSLATQALLFLTPQEDPETGKPLRNLELAKHSIDLLAVLEEKTKGNLDDRERRLLDAVLYQTRMAYVEAAR